MDVLKNEIHAALASLAIAMEADDKGGVDEQLIALKGLGRPQTYESIASTYEIGNGDIAPRDDLAYYWYSRSALEEDSAGSYFAIGRFYFDGKCVEANLSESTRFYKLAQSKGSHEAGIMLALRYINGEGVPVDLQLAEEYLAAPMDAGYVAPLFFESKIEFLRGRSFRGCYLWLKGLKRLVRYVFKDPHSDKLYALKTKEMRHDDMVAARKKSIEWSEKN